MVVICVSKRKGPAGVYLRFIIEIFTSERLVLMKRLTLFFCCLCGLFIIPFRSIAENSDFTEALKAAEEGDVKKVVANCGMIVTSEENPAVLAKAYTLLGMGYILEGEDNAKDRCFGLTDLLPDEVRKTPALPIIRLLAGEEKRGDLTKKITDYPQDWKAIANLCMYLTAVRDNEKINELYSYCKNYQDNIIGLPKNDWAVVWNPRLVKWHAWLQSGKGEQDKLEPMIASHGVKEKVKTAVDDQKQRQEAVCNVIKLYLQNDIAKAKEAAVQEKTTYSATSTPIYMVLDYLSGNNLITPEKIFETTKSSASTWALATVAMFAKSLSDGKEPDKQQLYYYIDNYNGNYQFLKEHPEIADWKPSIDRWRKWCDSGFKEEKGLEPLLRAKSNKSSGTAAAVEEKIGGGKDIAAVTAEEFVQGRAEKYQGRPKPASMDFKDDVFNKYLATLPEPLRATEKLRYTTVKDVKPYIVRVLERSPYPNGLILKNKNMSHGVVYMANENLLRFKKSTKSKKGTSYQWEDLAFEQYPAFMEYFAKRRLGVTGAGATSKNKIKKDAATEYLGIAILCDWFGQYEDALKNAKRAVELCPEMNDQVYRMMLE